MKFSILNWSVDQNYTLCMELLQRLVPSSQVKVHQGLNLRQSLKKALSMRDLSTGRCVAYVLQKNKRKCFLDWLTDTTVLGGMEVYIHVHVHVCLEYGVSWVRVPPEAAHFS